MGSAKIKRPLFQFCIAGTATYVTLVLNFPRLTKSALLVGGFISLILLFLSVSVPSKLIRKSSVVFLAFFTTIGVFSYNFFTVYQPANLTRKEPIDLTFEAYMDFDFETQTFLYGKATENSTGKSYKIALYPDRFLAKNISVGSQFQVIGKAYGTLHQPNLCRDGIYIKVYPTQEITNISPIQNRLKHAPYLLRNAIKTNLIQAYGQSTETAVLTGLLTGDKNGLTLEDKRRFSLSGTSHIMAVSGLHVSILLVLIVGILGRKIGSIVGIPIIILYAGISGFSPSAVRAVIMTGMGILALLVQRDYDGQTAFGLALFAILCANPFTLYNLGFTLSFSAVLGIMIFSPKLQTTLKIIMPKGNFLINLKVYLLSSLALSISASLITTWVTALTFDRISIVSVFSNILVIPLATLALWGGGLNLLISAFFPALGKFIGQMLIMPLLKLMVGIINFIAALPFSSVATNSIYLLIFLTALVLGAFIWRFFKSSAIPVLLTLGVIGSLCTYMTMTTQSTCLDMVIDTAGGMPVAYIWDGDRSVALGGGSGKSTGGTYFYDNQLFKYGREELDLLFLGKMNKPNVTGALTLGETVPIARVYGGAYSRNLFGLIYNIYNDGQHFTMQAYDLYTTVLERSEALFTLEFDGQTLLWPVMADPDRLVAYLADNPVHYDYVVLSEAQVNSDACYTGVMTYCNPKTLIVAANRPLPWAVPDLDTKILQLGDLDQITLRLPKKVR